MCLCYLWHEIIYFLFCVIVLSKKICEKVKKFLFFKRRKTIFLCNVLCVKIIREWNTENKRKITGLSGKNDKRIRGNPKSEKRELFWKRKKKKENNETSSEKKR